MTAAVSEMKALSTDTRKRIAAFSYLRVTACLAVVTLHTINAAEILYREEISLGQRTASLGSVYCLMWAVPCFVMVTGALLLDPRRSVTLKKIFTVYIPRILGALFLFGIVFRVFDIVMNGEPFGLLPVLEGVYRVFTGTSWAHLWYLYMLIGLYLLLPFYRMVARESSPALLRYLLGVYGVFLSLLPLTKIAGVTSAFSIPVSSIYPFYFFAGYAILSGALPIRRGVAAGMVLLVTAATAMLTVLRFYLPAETLDVLLTSYASPCVILQSMGIFALFLSGEPQENRAPKKAGRFFLWVDENSFGIYLIHMIFVRLVLRYMALDPYRLGWWFFPVFILGNMAVSCGITWLLRRIPVMRKVL